MKETSLKTKTKNLCKVKKHRYKIVRDYKEQTYYLFASLIFFLVAIFLIIVLSYSGFPYQSGIFVFIATFIGAFLYYKSVKCAICNKPRWVEQLEQVVIKYTLYFFFRSPEIKQDLSENKNIYCNNCDLTAAQMIRYIDILKSDAEINEENARKLFIEK